MTEQEEETTIQYIKLLNGESIIAFCSSELLKDGVYILHYPFKFSHISNPMMGTVVGSQLIPWIECANDGPIVLVANQVLAKVDPSDHDKIEYRKLVQRAKECPENGHEDTVVANDNERLRVVASNPEIEPSKSLAPVLLVHNEDEEIYDDPDDDMFDEEDDDPY